MRCRASNLRQRHLLASIYEQNGERETAACLYRNARKNAERIENAVLLGEIDAALARLSAMAA